MKKLISAFLGLIFMFMISLNVLADDGKTEKNVCYKKPVTVSTRYEFPQVYLNNVTDGDFYTRTSTDTQDLYGNHQWFRIDLCATYTVSEVLINALTEAGGVAKNIAVDVWSDGKWVRVAQKFNIKKEDYPISFYFDEIDCSYIQVSTNEPTSEKAASSWFGLSEIQAYHTSNILNSEKEKSFDKIPEEKEEIPMPQDIDAMLLTQGSREDSSAFKFIEPDSLKLPESVYDRTIYSFGDVTFLKKLYENTEKTNSPVAVAEKSIKNDANAAANFEDIEKVIVMKDGKTDDSSNGVFSSKYIILAIGAILIIFGIVFGAKTLYSVFKLRKVSKK